MNIILNGENLCNAYTDDDFSVRVYHANDWQNEDENEEEIISKYRIDDPTIGWNKMKPMVGDMLKPPSLTQILCHKLYRHKWLRNLLCKV